jgi:hypothetical protein
VMFTAQPGTFIEIFSVGYVLGSSRSLSALLLLDAAIQAAQDGKVLDAKAQELLVSCHYVWCTYDPLDSVDSQVHRSVMNKMRGSERQRPDVVQLAKAFNRAVEAKVAEGVAGPASLVCLHPWCANRPSDKL